MEKIVLETENQAAQVRKKQIKRTRLKYTLGGGRRQGNRLSYILIT